MFGPHHEKEPNPGASGYQGSSNGQMILLPCPAASSQVESSVREWGIRLLNKVPRGGRTWNLRGESRVLTNRSLGEEGERENGQFKRDSASCSLDCKEFWVKMGKRISRAPDM